MRFHGLPDVVFLAHGDAARGDDEVGALRGLGEGGNHRVVGVRQDAHVQHGAALRAQQPGDGVPVGIVDAARCEGGARLAEFVAGGDHRHAQRARHAERGPTSRSGLAQVLRAQAPAGAQHGLAGAYVLARLAPVVAAPDARGDDDVAARLACVFLHDHGVRAVGHARAGEDAHRFAAPLRPVEGVTGGHTRANGKLCFALGGQVVEMYRIAVHGRVVVRRDVRRRDHVFEQHPPQRFAERDRLRLGHARGARGDLGQRRIHAHELAAVGEAVVGELGHGDPTRSAPWRNAVLPGLRVVVTRLQRQRARRDFLFVGLNANGNGDGLGHGQMRETPVEFEGSELFCRFVRLIGLPQFCERCFRHRNGLIFRARKLDLDSKLVRRVPRRKAQDRNREEFWDIERVALSQKPTLVKANQTPLSAHFMADIVAKKRDCRNRHQCACFTCPSAAVTIHADGPGRCAGLSCSRLARCLPGVSHVYRAWSA